MAIITPHQNLTAGLNIQAALNPGSHNMSHGDRYSFYLRDNHISTHPTLYSEIISTATTKIVIWDSYIHEDDAIVFNSVSRSVDIEILTAKSNQGVRNAQAYCNDLCTAIASNLPINLRGTCNLKIAYVNPDIYSNKDIWRVHDRFLIIDDNEYYLIGSSMEYYRRPGQSTGIYHIEHEEDKEIIQEAYDKTYAECSQHNNVFSQSI